jgi:hypothetical protein
LEALAEDASGAFETNRANSLQVIDDGEGFTVCLNGAPLFGGRLEEARLSSETAVGLATRAEQLRTFVRDMEAHPRELRIPSELTLPLPRVRQSATLRIDESFRDASGGLDGHALSGRTGQWRRDLGRGRFELRKEGGVRVVGDPRSPNPGRTAYTVPWDYPNMADLSVRITPPGQRRGEHEDGRAGVIFMQDPENYVIVSTWLSDGYDGTSISSFFHLRGFEELYDAVWSNVGRLVHWGREYELRVDFDGLAFSASVDGETVLYRSLTDVCPETQRLSIRRVGIVANWEWGNDTGSVFHRFQARS